MWICKVNCRKNHLKGFIDGGRVEHICVKKKKKKTGWRNKTEMHLVPLTEAAQ